MNLRAGIGPAVSLQENECETGPRPKGPVRSAAATLAAARGGDRCSSRHLWSGANAGSAPIIRARNEVKRRPVAFGTNQKQFSYTPRFGINSPLLFHLEGASP